MAAVAGLQPSRNLAGTKTKMKLVGGRLETAKHHLNPSPKRAKTLQNRRQKNFETLPTEPSKDKKMAAVAGLQPSRNLAGTKTKMKLVGGRLETAKHHLNPSPKRAKTLRNPRHKKGRNVAYGTHKEEKK